MLSGCNIFIMLITQFDIELLSWLVSECISLFTIRMLFNKKTFMIYKSVETEIV
jgi:hypothetical protein